MKRGKLIVLEGVDGAGKTTQMKRLQAQLETEENIYGRVHFFHEPGSTEVGQRIRELILNHAMDAKTEMLLFFAARNELLREKILPALKRGEHVILDRFFFSTLAYQVYGRERNDLLPLYEKLLQEIVPESIVDMVFFLDLDGETAKERDAQRDEESTRFDREGLAFFERVREGYKKAILNSPHYVIDARKSIEEVWGELWSGVKRILHSEKHT